MVRICDGRMSGTAYGTVVLHVAPEAAAGGPLALGQTGDCDHAGRRRRVAGRSTSPDRNWRGAPRAGPPSRDSPHPTAGWERLYVDHVLQADTGADLDFLVGSQRRERQPRVALRRRGRWGRGCGQFAGMSSSARQTSAISTIPLSARICRRFSTGRCRKWPSTMVSGRVAERSFPP